MILLDISGGGPGTRDLIAEVRESWTRATIVLIGRELPRELEGEHRVLLKPVDATELLQVVRERCALLGTSAKRNPLNVEKVVIDDAFAHIRNAVEHVGHLGGFLPDDPVGWGLLRQQVEELRSGLIVLTTLADELQHLYDRQAAGSVASALRSALGCEPMQAELSSAAQQGV